MQRRGLKWRQPPKIAGWLLNQCVASPLAGDLIEEFQSGRSVGWLFWQLLVAALMAAKNSVLRDLSAVFIAWSLQLLAFGFFLRIYAPPHFPWTLRLISGSLFYVGTSIAKLRPASYWLNVLRLLAGLVGIDCLCVLIDSTTRHHYSMQSLFPGTFVLLVWGIAQVLIERRRFPVS